MNSTMKAWEQIKEGKDISIESLEAVINSEKSREAKQLVEETAANDKRIKEKSSLFESLSPLPKKEMLKLLQMKLWWKTDCKMSRISFETFLRTSPAYLKLLEKIPIMMKVEDPQPKSIW